MVTRRFVSSTYRVLCCALMAGCGSSGDPNPGDTLNLSVQILVDSTRFRSAGEFILDLVPADRTGQTFITDEWDITERLTAPSSVAITAASSSITPPDTLPVASAILIDDSGSMLQNDPDRQRAAAAQLFWNQILGRRPGNRVALLDFGRGNATPSAGFEKTTLLAGFTDDPAALDAMLDKIQAVPGGRTPLYETGAEVLAWIDSTVPGPARRSLVVITDGEPSDLAFADSLFMQASAHHIPIFAVGLGPAADEDPASTAALLVKELATRTGGVYAAADTATQLQAILQRLARSANPARLQLLVTLDPIPPRGADIAGTVAVSGARGRAATNWSFVAE